MDNAMFEGPSKETFTIYTKTKCEYCTKVKLLLEDNDIQYIAINCDDYLMNNREGFLSFIKDLASRDWKTFPIVFDNLANFVGGYIETQKYLEKKLNFNAEF